MDKLIPKNMEEAKRKGGIIGRVNHLLASTRALSIFVGLYVHIPLIILGFVIAFFTRTIGFTWLALLIVVGELLIVISRFIFSYEQSFLQE